MQKICFATNNKHKLEEVKIALLNQVEIVGLEEIGCTDELPENQTTLEGNAEEKAKYVWEHFQVPCFADDTGLEVQALQNEPGVYSARYAGPERDTEKNMDLVLDKLAEETNRSAQFRTVICLINEKGNNFFEGVVLGSIRSERQGNKGFGYDPIFEPEGYSCTFAEMGLEEKNKISHRGLAVKKLVDYLQANV